MISCGLEKMMFALLLFSSLKKDRQFFYEDIFSPSSKTQTQASSSYKQPGPARISNWLKTFAKTKEGIRVPGISDPNRPYNNAYMQALDRANIIYQMLRDSKIGFMEEIYATQET